MLYESHPLMKRGPGLHGTLDTDALRSPQEIAAEIAQKVRITTSHCEEWTGALGSGYGRIVVGWRLDSRNRRRQVVRKVHRVHWEQQRGPIPSPLCLDHIPTCQNRACRNLGHIEVVTLAENTRRGEVGSWGRSKTHCPQGHEYTEANTYRNPRGGGRQCKTCLKATVVRLRAAKKVAKSTKTHCAHGHEFSPENTYFPPTRPKTRACKACKREHGYRARDAAKAKEIQR